MKGQNQRKQSFGCLSMVKTRIELECVNLRAEMMG